MGRVKVIVSVIKGKKKVLKKDFVVRHARSLTLLKIKTSTRNSINQSQSLLRHEQSEGGERLKEELSSLQVTNPHNEESG